MDSIKINDPRATALREWLNERHKAYLVRPVTDAQLGIWLDEAAEHEGLIEIRSADSVSGAPETYRVALCAIEENDAARVEGVARAMLAVLDEIVGQERPNSWGYDAACVAMQVEWRARARKALADAHEALSLAPN